MKQNGEGQEWVIDSFYGESTGDNPEYPDFAVKMKACLEKMNVLHDEDIELKVDILEIIRQGERIREANTRREEGITFAIAAGIVVCSMALWSYLLGPEFILYAQVLLLGISAFVGVPFVKYLENREG